CVSQWGQDFRPSYLRIREFVESLPTRPVIGAFTATATPEVRADIQSLLGLQNPLCIATGFDRPNLRFAVEHVPQAKKMTALLRLLQEQKGRSGIVYCLARKTVEDVCESLCAHGIAATRYHAGLSDAERRQNQDDFLYDRAEVMVATNAFGMGIDKSNVAFVIHYNMPKNLESYYQEAGRAGRDGSPAVCTLLYSGQDVKLNAFLIDRESGNPLLNEEQARAVHEGMREGLRRMARYCTTGDCLRACILRYFGEEAPDRCGNCSNCDEEGAATVDVAEDARAVLRCVQELGQRYGRTLVLDVLRGSRAGRVRDLGLDACASFGALHRRSAVELRALVDFLLDRDALVSSGGEYPVLRFGPRARETYEEEPLLMRVRAEAEPGEGEVRRSRREGSSAKGRVPEQDAALFEELKALRSRLAAQARVPAYVVFSDAALRDMCAKRPTTPEEFLEVSGVGEHKLRRYGKAFLQVLRRY
ncbi:MAG: RecQ family ATP-dependent DNA helicase, partial [Candidatus Spyradocola sp.]